MHENEETTEETSDDENYDTFTDLLEGRTEEESDDSEDKEKEEESSEGDGDRKSSETEGDDVDEEEEGDDEEESEEEEDDDTDTAAKEKKGLINANKSERKKRQGLAEENKQLKDQLAQALGKIPDAGKEEAKTEESEEDEEAAFDSDPIGYIKKREAKQKAELRQKIIQTDYKRIVKRGSDDEREALNAFWDKCREDKAFGEKMAGILSNVSDEDVVDRAIEEGERLTDPYAGLSPKEMREKIRQEVLEEDDKKSKGTSKSESLKKRAKKAAKSITDTSKVRAGGGGKEADHHMLSATECLFGN